MDDFEDTDFIEKPDFELSIVLNAMNNSLWNMYEELIENIELGGDKYIPKMMQLLKKYNV